MKSVLKISLCFLVAALFMACEKDESRAILTPASSNSLTATPTTIVLVQANADQPGVTFTWGETKYGYSAAVNYTLEIARGGTNFAQASTTTANMGNLTTKSFTVGDFNAKMQDIIGNGTPETVEVRVKSEISPSVAPVYSDVVTLTVTAYKDIVHYEFPQALRIAGNFQGWSPGSAPKIVDKQAAGTTGSNYEGYINLTDANPEFKMVKGDDWPAGDFGSAGAGLLGNGGPNLSVTGGAGVYLIRANTNAMTWSFQKITTWGIIGNATPGDWGASTPMTFNASDGSWSITTNLLGGAGKEMKFRANDLWDLNFGDNAPADGKPDYGGDNIKIPADGNYTITLDIGLAGNYSYTIRRN